MHAGLRAPPQCSALRTFGHHHLSPSRPSLVLPLVLHRNTPAIALMSTWWDKQVQAAGTATKDSSLPAPSTPGDDSGSEEQAAANEQREVKAAGVLFYCLDPVHSKLHVLLIKQQKDRFNLPGGKRNNRTETPEQIAAREVEEETHWQISATDVLPLLSDRHHYWWAESKYMLYMIHAPDQWDLPDRVRQQIASGNVHPEAKAVTDAVWLSIEDMATGKAQEAGYQLHLVSNSLARILRQRLQRVESRLKSGNHRRTSKLPVLKAKASSTSKTDEATAVAGAANALGQMTLQKRVKDAGAVVSGATSTRTQQGEATQGQRGAGRGAPSPMIWPDGIPVSTLSSPPEVTVIDLSQPGRTSGKEQEPL